MRKTGGHSMEERYVAATTPVLPLVYGAWISTKQPCNRLAVNTLHIISSLALDIVLPVAGIMVTSKIWYAVWASAVSEQINGDASGIGLRIAYLPAHFALALCAIALRGRP